MHIVMIIMQKFLIFMFPMQVIENYQAIKKTAIEEFKTLKLPQWFRVFTGI
ncbi:hypothetical protein ACH2FV_01230 [Bacillus safensis subsp. safensis]|uniref:hypothetical protein n=1 Tax=Bacillus safensis TaxID=561879 RepID=UPI0037C18AE3